MSLISWTFLRAGTTSVQTMPNMANSQEISRRWEYWTYLEYVEPGKSQESYTRLIHVDVFLKAGVHRFKDSWNFRKNNIAERTLIKL